MDIIQKNNLYKNFLFYLYFFPKGGAISPFLCEASYISENIPVYLLNLKGFCLILFSNSLLKLILKVFVKSENSPIPFFLLYKVLTKI